MIVAFTWMVSGFELTSKAGLLKDVKRLLSSRPTLPLDLFRGGVLVLVSLLSKLRMEPLLIARPRKRCSSRKCECALRGGVRSPASWIELARTDTIDDFLLVGRAVGDVAAEDPREKLRCRSAIFDATPVPTRFLCTDSESSELGLSSVAEDLRDAEALDGDLSREPRSFAADERLDDFLRTILLSAGRLDFRAG